MAPPLSVTGVYQSLRWPTPRDMVFSLKAYLAVALCLLLGFWKNLENPYWSALTVYFVVLPPETGAVRSKCLFRLIGTVGGGLLTVALTGLVGDQLGILLSASIAVVVFFAFLRGIDRTATNYIWFSVGLTVAVIAFVDLEQPLNMFRIAVVRSEEIAIGILAVAAVDSLIWPRAMTPRFLDVMADWRMRAREWVIDALGQRTLQPPPSPEHRRHVRERLRQMTSAMETIDAQAVPLPYDIVATPPRSRDLNLVRLSVTHLIPDLAALEAWMGLRRSMTRTDENVQQIVCEVADWVRDSEDRPGPALDAHAARGEQLHVRLLDVGEGLAPRSDRPALIDRAILLRMVDFVDHWSDLALALRVVETRRPLPPRLARLVHDAKPLRSVDYAAVTRDVLPMALSLTVVAVFWYLTAWASAPYALLLAFIGCFFLTGQPGILRSGGGLMLCIGTAFAIDFAYLFAVLPRVTAYPVLIAVLALVLIPLGIGVTMTLAAMLCAAFSLVFLSLQSAYQASFQSSLVGLGASLIGLWVAIVCVYICTYDRPHFVASRLVRALRLEIADVACAPRMPRHERLLPLAVDRMSQLFNALESIPKDDPLHCIGVIDELRIGRNLLIVRREEAHLQPPIRAQAQALRGAIGRAFRQLTTSDSVLRGLESQVDALIDKVAELKQAPYREQLLAALIGIRFGVAPDQSPITSAGGLKA